ncbi:Leucine-zipper-like transcriptional regulator 1 [Marasmius crinis-equi]|uniref:Leucine-zipper-like transcriptional regulator 1 n=1 Tax=Marasmius crinis-equi TaxID=585013 RepID=A0ABR3FMD7_9AGAR
MFSRSLYLLIFFTVPRTVLSSGTWQNLTSISSGPRQEECVASIGNTIYVVGGITTPPPNDTFPPTVALVEAFDTTENTWRCLANLPTTMNHCNIASVNGKLYVLGGLNGQQGVWVRTGRAFEYCPQSDAWTELSSLPEGAERGSSAVGVWGDQVLLAGGIRTLNGPRGEHDTVATGLVYDTRTKKWSELPDLPDGRDHAGGAVVAGTFYVVGGRLGGRNNVRGTVFAMNLTGEERVWVEKSMMPTPRGGLAAAATDGKIYTFGGEGDPQLIGPAGVYNNTEVYDTETDSWKVLPPMDIPRHGTAASTVGGNIYIPGGGVMAAGVAPVNVMDVFIP